MKIRVYRRLNAFFGACVLWACLVWSSLGLMTQAASVHMTRLGYSPSDSKSFLVEAAPDNETFTVVDALGAIVFSGTTSAPLDDPLAGHPVRRGDFTELAKSGRYRIRLSDGPETSVATVAMIPHAAACALEDERV